MLGATQFSVYPGKKVKHLGLIHWGMRFFLVFKIVRGLSSSFYRLIDKIGLMLFHIRLFGMWVDLFSPLLLMIYLLILMLIEKKLALKKIQVRIDKILVSLYVIFWLFMFLYGLAHPIFI